ncbi:hypothetical protein J2W42_003243 [Rhizobium tibeticum]|uniref:Uncharacterized protein n=1 Tax=Rhizobium tibeticum TaxID=501024 RepID=A0A1H8S5F1_9HYPH|nr:hypothetical protein [Rhizobium tibeticum]SEI10408.1 hypothetical protein RTCCBAU85039_4543 [Rhizobium tibeticum]SEO73855.1 hypothetical protein SAMN05216228_102381 [Rhizobium tibeticum]
MTARVPVTRMANGPPETADTAGKVEQIEVMTANAA